MKSVNSLAVADNTELKSENTGMDEQAQKLNKKRRFYDIVFLIGFFCCLIPGPFPSLTAPASALMLVCILVCFFDENFYLYAALFLYMRYKMIVGDTPAFRVYSYLVVMKFLMVIFKTKFRVAYLPAIFVFFMHSIFAAPSVGGMRLSLNVIVDCALIYIILLQVMSDKKLLRKYLYVFLMGGIASGIYGWTNPNVTIDINVSGAGVHTVSRNFGALSDSNFAGLFYSLCTMCSLVLDGIPKWLRVVLVSLFLIMLLQTASLSGILVLVVLSCFLIVLKFRMKSVFILTFLFIFGVIALVILLSVPQFRQIEMIAGLIIRIEEKLSYIPRGRWDLFTTDRAAIWGDMMERFMAKSWWGKLIGGSVVTITILDTAISEVACHNSYIQSLMNFGVLGTLLIYIPLITIFAYRLYKHFTQKKGYEGEDVKVMQMIFVFAFLVFGMTVDFFIDWPFMMFYFM